MMQSLRWWPFALAWVAAGLLAACAGEDAGENTDATGPLFADIGGQAGVDAGNGNGARPDDACPIPSVCPPPGCVGVSTFRPQPVCRVAQPLARIDDFDDGDAAITVDGCRNGHWVAYSDGQTLLTPEPGAPVRPTPGGGAEETSYGLVLTADRVAQYAGTSVNFVTNFEGCGQPGIPFDASAFAGVRLRLRAEAPERELTVRLQFDDIYTHLAGGYCVDGCFDSFATTRLVTETWRNVELPFAEAAQDGWGDMSTLDKLDSARLYSFSVQVDARDEPFTLWIDDVRFYAR